MVVFAFMLSVCQLAEFLWRKKRLEFSYCGMTTATLMCKLLKLGFPECSQMLLTSSQNLQGLEAFQGLSYVLLRDRFNVKSRTSFSTKKETRASALRRQPRSWLVAEKNGLWSLSTVNS